MKNILIPTDFSAAASNAMDVAFDIAKRQGADIVVLHVVEEAESESFNISGEITGESPENKLFTYKLLERGREKLAEFINNPKYKEVKVTGELRLGNAFHGITSIIAGQNVDLIVMGTRGHNAVEEIVLGSTAEKVVRRCKHPVLTVHQKPATFDFKNIVYATSMDESETAFIALIKNTQKVYNAVIHLVRINTSGNFRRDVEVKASMAEFIKKQGLTNCTINVFSDYSEEEGIIYFADSINADMIAMATHGRSGFAQVLGGSIAEDVVAHAKRPVLTYLVK